MKCIQCGTQVSREAPQRITAEFRGSKLNVEITAPSCPKCGRVALVGHAMRNYGKALADAYRREKGLLTMGELEAFRRSLRMTQLEFADYVFIGIATLKRWMRGEIQTEAYDKLVRLRVDPMYLQQTREELLSRMTIPLSDVVRFDTPKSRLIGDELDEDSGIQAGAA